MHWLALLIPFSALHSGLHEDHQALPGIRLRNVSKGQYKAFKTSTGLKGNILMTFCQNPSMAPTPRGGQPLVDSNSGVTKCYLTCKFHSSLIACSLAHKAHRSFPTSLQTWHSFHNIISLCPFLPPWHTSLLPTLSCFFPINNSEYKIHSDTRHFWEYICSPTFCTTCLE